MTGLLDLGECPLLDACNLAFAVYLSTVHTQQPSRENHDLMRYSSNLSGHLVSTLWQCKSHRLKRVTWESVCRWTRITYHLQYICHIQRPHQHLVAKSCLLNLSSDFLVCLVKQSSALKHRENCKKLPREHLIGCQVVKMFFLKDPFKVYFVINWDLSLFKLCRYLSF